MASPQLSNGYTPISNELLEAILRTPLSAREMKALLAVARETYGWQRKATTLTAYRVAKLMGLEEQRSKAARALRRLKARNILQNGSAGLGLQKDYEAWRPDAELDRHPGPNRTRVQTGPGSKTDPKTGSKRDPVPGSKSDPTKERLKKESKRAAPPAPPAHGEILAEYDRLFQAKFGARPDIVGGRDGTIVANLLRRHPAAEVRALLRGFFAVGTRWSREMGRADLPAFKASYNELLVMRARGELGEA